MSVKGKTDLTGAFALCSYFLLYCLQSRKDPEGKSKIFPEDVQDSTKYHSGAGGGRGKA